MYYLKYDNFMNAKASHQNVHDVFS